MNVAAALTAAAETAAEGVKTPLVELHFTAGELLLTLATLALVAVTYMLWKVTATTLRHEADKAAEVATAGIETAGRVSDNAIDSIEHVAVSQAEARAAVARAHNRHSVRRVYVKR
jgi:hypothetical protein